MVADHARHVHRVVALADPTQQVMQAVAFLGHQDHGLAAVGGVPEFPVGGVGGELRELRADLLEVQVAGADGQAGEEFSGGVVGEEVGLVDPTAPVREETGEFGHDAGAVGANDSEYIMALGHSIDTSGC